MLLYCIPLFVFIPISKCADTTETREDEEILEGPGFFTLLLQSLNPFATEETLADLANRLARVKNYEKAIEFYDRVIEQNSSNVLYYIARGNCYKEMGNFDTAFWDFDKAISKSINSGKEETLKVLNLDDVSLAEIGRRLHITWKFKEALYCYNEAIKKNQSVVSYYKGRALCHIGMENYETAISDYRTVLELDSRDEDSRIRLSRALSSLGNYDEAIKEILHLDGVPRELINLCDYLRQKGINKEALSCYSEAIVRGP